MFVLGPTDERSVDVAPPDARPALERVARLAARVGGASAALVAVAEGGEYVVVAGVGAPQEVLGRRLPVAHRPGRGASPAGIAARLAAEVATCLGWSEAVGVPVRGRAREILGAILVRAPRADAALADLAALAADELALAAAAAAERRARADEARLRALVQHGSDLLGLLDADGCVRYLSPAVLRALGPHAANAIGSSVFDLVHPADVPQAETVLAQVRTGAGARATARLRAATADDAVRTLDVVAENRLDDRDVQGVVVAARDVTHAVALEGQLRHAQKLEAVGRLASGLAHDFNNVLTVIGTSARLVRETLANDVAVTSPVVAATIDADLDEIERGVQRAAALTRQLLAFGRARPSPAPAPVPLPAMVRGVEGMIRRVLGEHVDVVLALDESVDTGLVLADRGNLEHVVLNLAMNARDAMPDGGVFVVATRTLHVTPAEAELVGCTPGAWVVLEVLDTGTGMDADAQARAFEPFFSTKAAAGQGSGLGLAMVRAIVGQAGGRVTVRSEVGVGTTFTLWFPRMASAAIAVDDPPATHVVNASSADDAPVARDTVHGRETVLVVEDEAGVRQIARRALERLGYRVLDARHGAEALRVWTAHDGPAGCVDLVLTDFTMPVMGGRELVTRLRACRPEQAVLVMSGRDEDGARAWAEGEAFTIVAKPFGAADLAARLRTTLDAVRW